MAYCVHSVQTGRLGWRCVVSPSCRASQSLQRGVEQSEIHSGEMYRLGMCVYINFTVFLTVLPIYSTYVYMKGVWSAEWVVLFTSSIYVPDLPSFSFVYFGPLVISPRFVVWILDILINPGAPRPALSITKKYSQYIPVTYCPSRGFSKVKMFLNGSCYGARYGATTLINKDLHSRRADTNLKS